jgi:hypothetical protein
MLAQQIIVEANNINQALRERNWTRRKRDRRALLGRAVEASLAALPVLAAEPLITDTDRYLGSSFERLGNNGEALREEMRQDALVLQMFINAQCHLLREIGVEPSMIEDIANSMVTIITAGTQYPQGTLSDRLGQLISELQTDLDMIRRESQRDGTAERLAGALGVLGGSLVVAADAAAAVASHGIAAGAAGASVSVGSAMVGRSLDEALG